jgi:lipid-binding SYLF domain-containing protein
MLDNRVVMPGSGEKKMRLQKIVLFSTVFLSLYTGGTALAANSDQEAKLDEVMEVLNTINAIPENTIPPKLLSNAEGIAIIPSVVKVGVILGGRYGKGVLVLRNKDKEWGNPLFISVKGGSIGWQIGAQSTDVILVFKNKKSLQGILKGKFTLGADASVAAGPVGRKAAAATDAQLQSEIYSYSRSRGLFVGVALDGAALKIEHKDNSGYYRKPEITPEQIIAGQGLEVPASTAELLRLFDQYTEGAKDDE